MRRPKSKPKKRSKVLPAPSCCCACTRC